MYSLLVTLLMAPVLAAPQLPSGETILKQILEKAQTRRSVEFILDATVTTTQAGKPVPPRTGENHVKVFFVNPGLVRIEEQGLMGNRLQVSDGEWSWLFDPARKQYTKTFAALRLGTFSLPSSNWMGGLPVSEIQGTPQTLREESIEIDDRRYDSWVITGPLRVPPGISNAVMTSWIDKTLGLGIRHEVELRMDPPSVPGQRLDPQDIKISMKLRSIKIDEDIAPDKFAFVEPADAKEVEFFSSALDRTGKPAASFDVKDLEGKAYSLNALKGKPVLLDFWATWCKPCAEAAPTLEKINREFKDRLTVLAVNVGENRRIVDAYLKPNPKQYPVVMGSDFGMEKSFEVSSFPTFILIGADGNIKAQQIGYRGEASLVAMLSAVGLTKAAPAVSSTNDPPRPVEMIRNRLSGIATDSQGNAYVADSFAAVVRRVAANGSATTFAGTGIPGFSGDGGAASEAQLAQPVALAVDRQDNVYIADAGNAHVRKVTPAGIISVFPGATQLQRITGVAVDASGNLYVAEAGAHRVKKISPDGSATVFAGTGVAGVRGDGGPATAAQLASPAAVAVDSAGNLYIADTGNRRIRVVRTDGTINLAAGNGSEGFSGDNGPAVFAQLRSPSSVAVDGKGNLYIADSGNFRIRKVSADGTITTVAGSGTSGYTGDLGAATEARFGSISSLAVDAGGNIYATDITSGGVRVFIPGGIINTLTGSATNGR